MESGEFMGVDHRSIRSGGRVRVCTAAETLTWNQGPHSGVQRRLSGPGISPVAWDVVRITVTLYSINLSVMHQVALNTYMSALM
jgi:hypothetical protein